MKQGGPGKGRWATGWQRPWLVEILDSKFSLDDFQLQTCQVHRAKRGLSWGSLSLNVKGYVVCFQRMRLIPGTNS